jgi:hypothetical protein
MYDKHNKYFDARGNARALCYILFNRVCQDSNLRPTILSCMYQPVQPKSLNWYGKVSTIHLNLTPTERLGRSGGSHTPESTIRARTPSAAPPLELGVGRLGLQIKMEANSVPKRLVDARGYLASSPSK